MRRRIVAAIAALWALALSPSAYAQSTASLSSYEAPARLSERAELNRKVFDRVWRTVSQSYYDERYNGVDWGAMRETYRPRALAARDERALYQVLGEMMDRLDDAHANVTSPTAVAYDANRDKPRPQLGVLLLRADGRYLLEDVRSGSPAYEAQVQLGWEVRSIDGKPFYPGLLLEPGVPVAIEFVDDMGAVRTMRITPRLMEPPVRRRAQWRDGAFVLAFDGFDAGVGKWVEGQLSGLPRGTPVVLDLRNNRGGLLVEANDVLSCFLPAGLEWAQHRPRRGAEAPLVLRRACRSYDGPVAVLVNGASRSAAELVPAALQENGRAIVVGRRTAGDVLVSTEWKLPDGGEMSLSIADIHMAGGARLEKNGVQPDIAATTSLDDRRAGRDPALDAAVAAVKTNSLSSRTARSADPGARSAASAAF